MFFPRFLINSNNRTIYKLFHSSCTLNVSPKKESPLFSLRKKTGLAYNLCREALTKHDNNIDEAEAWLKAQALAFGLQKATKVSGRITREGLIGIAIGKSNKSAFVLELNCETDFVAKNQVFKDLVLELTHDLATAKFHESVLKQSCVRIFELDREQLDESKIAPVISKLGENIKIHQASHYLVEDSSTWIFGQIHAQAGQKNTELVDISSGRFGALVALKDIQNQDFSNSRSRFGQVDSVGRALCRHIIGFNPSYLELPESIRKNLEEAEKNSNEDDLINESVTEENLYFSDHEGSESTHNSRDDWPSLMDQTLIMSGDRPIRDYCKDNKISVIYFKRFESGV